MNFIEKHKGKIITTIVIAVALLISYFLPTPENVKTDYQEKIEIAENMDFSILDNTEQPEEKESKEKESKDKEFVEKEQTQTHTPTSSPIPTQTPTPAAKVETPTQIQDSIETEEREKPEPTEELEMVQEKEKTPSCTLTVRCDTILKNLDRIAHEKVPLIPENGVILPVTKIEFSQGETVFDVLLRELKKNKIHLEFQGTTVYDSVYIEGIGNLYEFDCGNLSGWLYRINGKVPSVGCSSYEITDGDRIEFLYTCNMGRDL